MSDEKHPFGYSKKQREFVWWFGLGVCYLTTKHSIKHLNCKMIEHNNNHNPIIIIGSRSEVAVLVGFMGMITFSTTISFEMSHRTRN